MKWYGWNLRCWITRLTARQAYIGRSTYRRKWKMRGPITTRCLVNGKLWKPLAARSPRFAPKVRINRWRHVSK